MFEFLKAKKGTGALFDTRTAERKEKDYKIEELIAGFDPVNWVEKPKESWRRFPIYDQNGSGSCVAQTMAKLVGILYWLKNNSYVHFSATHIYKRRLNKPQAGMGGTDAFDVARTGVTLEELVPSQRMTDEQMDNAPIESYKEDVGKIFKIGNFLTLTSPTIDAVASVIQKTGKGVMVWFYFEIPEWTEMPYIRNATLNPQDKDTARHSVTAVDFTLINGKKHLIIDDSWGTSYGMAGQRAISEEFFAARNFFAAYPMNFAFDAKQIERPRHSFDRDLHFSPVFEVVPEVKFLQDALKYEGVFPLNAESSGWYGAVTARAVLDFQKKYAIDTIEALNALQGRILGPKTRRKLNVLFG